MTVKSTVRSAVRSAIRGTVRSGGALLPEWTPIYDGLTTFGELYNAWQPSGNDWEARVTYFDPTPKTLDPYVVSTGEFATGTQIRARSDGRTIFRTGGVEIDIYPPSDDLYRTVSANSSDGEFTPPLATTFGAFYAGTIHFFEGQIHRIQLLDNYDTGRTEHPVNGRDVVELDGLTQYGEIPAWSATNGVVEFDFMTNDVSVQNTVFSGGSVNANNILSDITIDGDIRFFTYDSAGQLSIVVSSVKCKPLTVYSVSCSFGGGQISISVNGELAIVQPATLDGGELLTEVGGRGTTNLLTAFAANLRLTDLDNPSNSRYYPLDRADIIQDVNGDGSTDGNWINAPQAVHRPNNSIDINTVKRSKDAPNASDNKLVNSLNGQEVGSITNLTGYQPVLKGGGLNRENVPDKFEAFNGDRNSDNYKSGVSIVATQMSSFVDGTVDTAKGSYYSSADEDFDNAIYVANGAVVRGSRFAGTSTYTIEYTTLQGTDEQIQKGFEYPNVFRVIKSTDTSGEWSYYNEGGSYPWIP